MRRPVCYDVTRLLTRILNATPNGIDRVDYALARHFLSGDPDRTYGATATGLGTRLMSGPAAADAVGAIATHWGESGRDVEADPAFKHVAAWLAGAPNAVLPPARRKRIAPIDIRGAVSWTRRHGISLKQTPAAALPQHSVYINSSQFPLWVASSFEWLETRSDVRAAFFIHDLLPVQMPEYFRAAEYERHRKRLQNFARFGTAAIVTTQTVAQELEAYMAKLGRKDVPIFVAPIPVSPTFATSRVLDEDLSERPYFVFCSTIEPRKNHLMILAVWRALVERFGSGAPRLVLVGTRGWHYDPIIDLVERCPALEEHVLEVNGLSTPALKRLIDNARALLMPTFGEGYGLPVHEALAAGAPVVASDIPVFREIDAPGLTRLSPIDGKAWFDTIAMLAHSERPIEDERPSFSERPTTLPAGWSGYFSALDAFVEAL